MHRPRIEDTLTFAAEQAERLSEAPKSMRWLVIGLVTALQEACVMALTAYDSAEPEDILVKQGGDVASLKTLLRRVSSEQYLMPPEKLGVPGGVVARALALNEARNLFLHPAPNGVLPSEADLYAGMQSVLDILTWLLVDHPAFDDPVLGVRAARQISHVRAVLEG